jgi:uncharacterized coiled-coil DUF342 family protein
VNLTNEEISQAKQIQREKLAAIQGQLADVRGRLHKLYDALETGRLEVDDLAPRIKDLKGRVDELEEQKRDVIERVQESKGKLVGTAKVRAYVDDLRVLLSKGSLMEQKAFPRSFIKRIEIDQPVLFSTILSPSKSKR